MAIPQQDNITTTSLGKVRIGLPIWQHPQWRNTWLATATGTHQLAAYAKHCQAIEGNTSFYQVPEVSTLCRWRDAVPEHFRFTFKFHQSISHDSGLIGCEQAIDAQLEVMRLLGPKLGLLLLQLPAAFCPQRLSALEKFLRYVPSEFTLAVEVRHPAFFAKQEDEKAFNQLLIAQRANRMIMDTRALFTEPAEGPLMLEVRQKKPRVPVNVIATANHPVVRFVGHNDNSINTSCLLPWVKKCHEWRLQGKDPYFFFHCADNKDAPWLAQHFVNLYNTQFATTPLPHIVPMLQPSLL